MVTIFDHGKTQGMSPHEFRRSVQRLMIQNEWDAFSTDGPGDAGGDIYAERLGHRWIFQSKWKKNAGVGLGKDNRGRDVVDEILEARRVYDAHVGILVTNLHFTQPVHNKVKRLSEQGIDIRCWEGNHLRTYAAESPPNLSKFELRPYQSAALDNVVHDLETRKRSLLFLATGLGKTVVAGAVIKNKLASTPGAKVLVLAHTDELIEQLQRALWSDIPFDMPSQLINSDNGPDDLQGLTISTNLSILKYIQAGYRPDFLVVDECHRVGESNIYGSVIEALHDVPILGVTATPWRGDGYEVETVFGKPSFTCGIEEGMKEGYLAPVDYQLYCDNIDWDVIPTLSSNAYTIGQLNKRLFIPQRDETIIDALSEQWMNISSPKCIVFCQSVEHAERFHKQLLKYDRWRDAEILHSKLDRNSRKFALLKFRGTECNTLVAVDILNEGIDVPDVNLVCFARVTHSRRIFVQQLGRGLRVAEHKEKVVVLDFAADVKRLAAIHNLQSAMEGDGEVEVVPYHKNSISFTDQGCKALIEEWIKDAADLETRTDESRLQFPPT